MKTKLYNLLYEWEVWETCDFCQHIETFSDDDGRHPCNRCNLCDNFKLSKNIDADLKDKVKMILEIIKK